jgi:hypothetical protein
MQWEVAIGFARKDQALRDAVDQVLDQERATLGALAA